MYSYLNDKVVKLIEENVLTSILKNNKSNSSLNLLGLAGIIGGVGLHNSFSNGEFNNNNNENDIFNEYLNHAGKDYIKRKIHDNYDENFNMYNGYKNIFSRMHEYSDNSTLMNR